jgi:hypothetical protein
MFSQSAAEERVKMFDRIAPQLISDQEKTQSERAFAVALVAFSCRPGMSHQSSLLAPYIPLLPEAAIWLGAMQASNPVTETLAIGDGLGGDWHGKYSMAMMSFQLRTATSHFPN